MPFAQWHYPFENNDIFDSHFPADFISEAIDQTRGWFYSLLAISTLIFNKAPYKNVIVLGHVLDENGEKMSKSKGNAVDPFEALAEHGADAIRWYFYSNSAPWLPNKFSKGAVTEGQRKFLGTLWNTYAFYILYANIDSFDPTKYTLDREKLPVMDKWILSKLNSLINTVDDALANYKIPETARALQAFVDDLSNWYVRRSRERFWVKEMTQDKINAYMTLYTCLKVFSQLSAPMIPFMTETIWQNIVKKVDKDAPESIHLSSFPVADDAFIDKDLEEKMAEVLDIVVLGRNCRNAALIKNRQPIAKIYVKSTSEPLSEFFTDVISDELNAKEVKFVEDAENFISFSFKPQLRTLGRRFGKNLGIVREILANLDGNKAMKELETTGQLIIEVEGNSEALTKDDLLIESKQLEGFEGAADKGITVILDTNLTPELIEEGFVRELVSKLQTMRKDSGFEVMDNICIYLAGNENLKGVAERNADKIKDDVLAKEIFFDAEFDSYKEWDINGEKVSLGVKRV
jgi:isoleucyl-tRNA synthetase